MQGSANLNVMIKAARKARAAACVKDFGEVENLQVSTQGRRAISSAAPTRAAEKIIREELMDARPTYGWLGEEGGEDRGQGPDPPLDRRSAGRHHQLPARHAALGDLHRAGAQGRDRRRRDLRPGQGRAVLCREGRGRLAERRAACGSRAAHAMIESGLRHRPALRRPQGPARDAAGPGAAAAGLRRRAALGRGRARPRLCRGRPLRRLLGARAEALGHGRGHPAGARGRRLRRADPPRGPGPDGGATSSPPSGAIFDKFAGDHPRPWTLDAALRVRSRAPGAARPRATVFRRQRQDLGLPVTCIDLTFPATRACPSTLASSRPSASTRRHAAPRGDPARPALRQEGLAGGLAGARHLAAST